MTMDPSPRESHGNDDEDQDDQDTQEDQEEKDGNDDGSESNGKPENSPGEMFRTAVSSLEKNVAHTKTHIWMLAKNGSFNGRAVF